MPLTSPDTTDSGPHVRVLIVDKSESDRDQLREALASDPRLEVAATDDPQAALDRLAGEPVRLCVADLHTHGTDGPEFVRAVRRLRRPVRLVATAAGASIAEAVNAVRLGADDFLPKPINEDRLRQVVEQVLADDPGGSPNRFHGIVSCNSRMHAIFALVQDVGPTTATVLIQGETGTGKEQLGRAIHASSDGRDGPFVAVNCAAVPETLLEAELFGHEKGAFTGADRQRIGKFELANTGTLFIDEVGDIPATMQVKLLRVLQERQFERVGGVDPVPVDVRVIAATNRPLRKMVRKGQFRDDLYYRLNVVRIDLPPLRARADDIPTLAEHFCRKYTRAGTASKRLSEAALDRLARYSWPGNIRELENVIERACVIHTGELIEPSHLPPELNRAVVGGVPHALDLSRPLRDVLRECTVRLEKRYIIRALKKTRGHVGRAARICGYCRRSLTAKISEYKIDRLAYTRKE